MDVFFSPGAREARGEATLHTGAPHPQESPSHPSASNLPPMLERLSPSGREWYQDLDAHSKKHIEKLLWGNQEEALSSLSDLKNDKEFLHTRGNPEGVLDIFPSFLDEKLQKEIARWLRSVGSSEKSDYSRREFANSLADRLQDGTFHIRDSVRAELILTLATLKTPSPLVRLTLKNTLEKKHQDPDVRKAAIAATMFLKTHDPSLMPYLPKKYQVEDPQWKLYEDFSFSRDHRNLEELKNNPISDPSLLLEIASVLPPKEAYPILQQHKISDPSLVYVLFRGKPRLSHELLNLIKSATDLGPSAHPARKELVHTLSTYWEHRDNQRTFVDPQIRPLLTDTLRHLVSSDKAIHEELISSQVAIITREILSEIHNGTLEPLNGKELVSLVAMRLKERIRFIESDDIHQHIALSLVLLHALEADTDPRVRSVAASALGELKPSSDKVALTLIHALEADNDPTVRWKSAEALGWLKPSSDKVSLALVRALEADKERNVRSYAAKALGKLKPSSDNIALILVHALEADKDPVVRSDAAMALEKLKPSSDKVALALVHVLETNSDPTIRDDTARVLGSLKPSSDKVALPLVHVLKADESFYVRWHVASALNELKPSSDKAVLDLLHALEADNDPTVRWKSAEALGWLKPSSNKVALALIHALEGDKDHYVRWMTAKSLGELKPSSDKIALALVHALEADKDPSVRSIAADALSDIAPRSPKILESLERLSKDKALPEDVRESAIEALTSIKKNIKK